MHCALLVLEITTWSLRFDFLLWQACFFLKGKGEKNWRQSGDILLFLQLKVFLVNRKKKKIQCPAMIPEMSQIRFFSTSHGTNKSEACVKSFIFPLPARASSIVSSLDASDRLRSRLGFFSPNWHEWQMCSADLRTQHFTAVEAEVITLRQTVGLP